MPGHKAVFMARLCRILLTRCVEKGRLKCDKSACSEAIAMSSANLNVTRVVERQMRNWELARQHGGQSQVGEAGLTIQFYIAISRELGSQGEQVADRLAECLNWAKYDREILTYMAENEEVRQRLYETLDERQRNWLQQSDRPFRADGRRGESHARRVFPLYVPRGHRHCPASARDLRRAGRELHVAAGTGSVCADRRPLGVSCSPGDAVTGPVGTRGPSADLRGRGAASRIPRHALWSPAV